MMLVAVIALSGSTFAWFAVNNKVTATGMNVSTVVQNNLFIAAIDADASELPDEADFGTTTQSMTAVLEPVSSVDGQKFFYASTKDINGAGSVKDDSVEYLSYATGIDNDAVTTDSYGNDFELNYQVAGAVGYADYVFALKAVNTGSEADINLTELVISYSSAAGLTADTTAYAHRVAILSEKWDAENEEFGAIEINGIMAPTGASNFTDAKAVKAAGAASAALDDVDPEYNDITTLKADANDTTYYRITIRLWLEGEDVSCNNSTFQKLTADWKLDIGFKLGAGTEVKNLTKGVYATVTADGDYKNNTYIRVAADKYYKLGGDMELVTVEAELTAVKAIFGDA